MCASGLGAGACPHGKWKEGDVPHPRPSGVLIQGEQISVGVQTGDSLPKTRACSKGGSAAAVNLPSAALKSGKQTWKQTKRMVYNPGSTSRSQLPFPGESPWQMQLSGSFPIEEIQREAASFNLILPPSRESHFPHLLHAPELSKAYSYDEHSLLNPRSVLETAQPLARYVHSRPCRQFLVNVRHNGPLSMASPSIAVRFDAL